MNQQQLYSRTSKEKRSRPEPSGRDLLLNVMIWCLELQPELELNVPFTPSLRARD